MSPEFTAALLRTDACLSCDGKLVSSVGDLFDTRFGISGRYEVRRCVQCGLEQLYPVPAPAELKRLYETYYNFGGEKGTLYTRLREWFLSSRVYRLWMFLDGDISFHLRRGRGRLLDVGCNEGRSMRIFANHGFQVEGLELNESAAAAARAANFTVHTSDLSGFRPPYELDVVVLSNVLEHSLSPNTMLEDVRRVLKRDGEVWISCPNSDSWMRSIFGRFWINWHVPFHIAHFSQARLVAALLQAGFGNIRIRQATPALWVGSSMIAALFARPGASTRQLRNSLLVSALLVGSRAVLFPLLWIANRLGKGDCLVAVATAR